MDGPRYREALDQALRRIRSFEPAVLVVALGLDTAKGDPTGTWSLTPDDLHENGRRVGALGLPTLVVQEGGYRTRTLGRNARAFFEGLHKGATRGMSSSSAEFTMREDGPSRPTWRRCAPWSRPRASSRTRRWRSPPSWCRNGWRRAQPAATSSSSPTGTAAWRATPATA